MAKSKKDILPKKKKKAGTSQMTKDSRSVAKTLEGDLNTSSRLADKFIDLSPLSRVDDSRPQETQNILNLKWGQADPGSAAYAGRRSKDIADIISRFKSGLDGYTSAELQANREAQQREGDQNLRTSIDRIQSSNARNGVRGAAAGAAINNTIRAREMERQNLEQDLFIKNADEKQNRLKTYGDVVANAEKSEWDKGQAALKAYEDTLKVDRDDRFARTKVNLSQEAVDRQKTVAGRFGLAGLLSSMRGELAQNRLAGVPGYGGAGRRRGATGDGRTRATTTSSSTNTQGDPAKTYMTDVNKLYNDYISQLGGA